MQQLSLGQNRFRIIGGKVYCSYARRSFKLGSKKNYAELWVGSYPTTPALVLASGEELQKYINANKEKLIGRPILEKFGVDLPYLPKVRPSSNPS